MRVKLEIDGDFRKILSQDGHDAKIAVTRGVRMTAETLKSSLRGHIAAGLGTRMGNTVQLKHYPKDGTPSLRAASEVYVVNSSKSNSKLSAAGIVDVFNKGAVISANRTRWLAIPLDVAGKGKSGAHESPSQWSARTGVSLKFVPLRHRAGARGAVGMLVTEGARFNKRGLAVRNARKIRKDGIRRDETSIPVFLLLRQVSLKKRLNVEPIIEAAVSQLAGNILAAWPEKKA